MRDLGTNKHLFTGPLPFADIPQQKAYVAWCNNWEAWDVPRIWHILEPEDNPLGWEQALGLAELSGVLYRYHQDLTARCHEISEAWQSSAGQLVLAERPLSPPPHLLDGDQGRSADDNGCQ